MLMRSKRFMKIVLSRNEVKIQFRADFQKWAKLEQHSLNKDLATGFYTNEQVRDQISFGQNMKILDLDEV